jgi:hypothetical protein
MAEGRRGRLQYKWDCWRGNRREFERVLATFDDVAVGAAVHGDAAGAGTSVAEATSLQRGETAERRGDWRTLLDEVDVEGLAAFTVAVPEPMREAAGDLRLEFSRSDGVVLWAGPGYGDAIQRVRTELEPAMAPGVPKRSWWYSDIAELVTAALLGIVIEFLWLVVSNHLGHPDVLDFVPLPIGILVAFGVLRLLRPFFPRFQVRDREKER